MAEIVKRHITREDLSKYPGRSGSGLSLGTEFTLKLENGLPCLVEGQFTIQDSSDVRYFPEVVVLTTRGEKTLALSAFRTKSFSAYASADAEKATEVSAPGLCAQDAVYEEIFDTLVSVKDAKFKMVGKTYYSFERRRSAIIKAANKI